MQPDWYDDPFGRHGHRFFDGTRWTPHVKDGEEHGFDEPTVAGAPEVAAPVASAQPAATAALLAQPVLVVRPRGGSRDGLDVLDPAGVRLGEVRRAARGRFDVLGATGAAVLSVSRASASKARHLEVRDAADAEVGRIVQARAWGRTRVGLEGPQGFAGYVVAEDWARVALRVEDRVGHPVARVGKGPTGDGHVVTLDEALPEPLRSLAVAATLCLDAAFKRPSLLP